MYHSWYSDGKQELRHSQLQNRCMTALNSTSKSHWWLERQFQQAISSTGLHRLAVLELEKWHLILLVHLVSSYLVCLFYSNHFWKPPLLMQSVLSQLGGAKSISCNTTCLQPHFARRWHLGHGSGLQWHHLLERQQISLAIPPERIRAHRKNWMTSWRSLTLTSKILGFTWLIYAPSPFLPFFLGAL